MSGRLSRLALGFTIGAAAFFVYGCESQEYPWGRDTKDSFGDGRFQILRASRPEELLLYDCERHYNVVRHVKNWKAKSGSVFLVNEAGRCWKVDYRTATVASFETPDAADEKDRELFQELLR